MINRKWSCQLQRELGRDFSRGTCSRVWKLRIGETLAWLAAGAWLSLVFGFHTLAVFPGLRFGLLAQSAAILEPPQPNDL